MNTIMFRSQVCSALLSLVMTTVLAGGASAAGPDLLGIRVGMTPEEALSILKARAPKEKWQTVKLKLKFNNARQQFAYVPNGEFRAVIENNRDRAASALNQYSLHLTPTPGNERVAAFCRVQNFGQERAVFNDVIAGLIEKYGKPSFRDKNYPGKLIWAFDANGKPQPLGLSNYIANHAGFPCTNSLSLVDTGWGVKYEPKGIAYDMNGKKIEVSLIKTCGATMIRANVMPFGEGFAQALNIELISNTLATAGKESADKLIESAIADDLAREHGAAKKRSKPDI
jgi:hypothetical protein